MQEERNHHRGHMRGRGRGRGGRGRGNLRHDRTPQSTIYDYIVDSGFQPQVTYHHCIYIRSRVDNDAPQVFGSEPKDYDLARNTYRKQVIKFKHFVDRTKEFKFGVFALVAPYYANANSDVQYRVIDASLEPFSPELILKRNAKMHYCEITLPSRVSHFQTKQIETAREFPTLSDEEVATVSRLRIDYAKATSQHAKYTTLLNTVDLEIKRVANELEAIIGELPSWIKQDVVPTSSTEESDSVDGVDEDITHEEAMPVDSQPVDSQPVDAMLEEIKN